MQAFRLAGFIFICKHAPRLYCQFSIILKGFDQKGYEVKMTFVSSSVFFFVFFLLFLFIYFRCSIVFYSVLFFLFSGESNVPKGYQI